MSMTQASATEHPFIATLQSASQSWQTFALDTKRPQFQQAAAQTKANNQQSLKSRKTLAETTKTFKKTVKQTESAIVSKNSNSNNDGTKASFDKLSTQCKSIVKSYQEEIDALTKRCKSSDGTFMDVYKSIIDMPDPAPIFLNAIEQIHSLNGQVQHLLKGMEEMQGEMVRKEKESKKVIGGLELDVEELEAELEKCQKENERVKADLALANAASKKSATDNAQKNSGDSGSNGHLSKEEREELISLRREVAEYEVEFKTLKNQDITIKKLNTKIENLIQNQENELQDELKKAREHLAQTEGRRVTEALEREATTARKLASLELELKAERAGSQAAQTHMLEADQGQNEREAVWEAQRQILVDDSDRLREVLHEVTRERDSLKMRVEAMTGKEEENGGSGNGSGSNGGGDVSMVDMIAERKAYEAEVGELTLTMTAMREELRTKDDTMFKLQSSMQATVESLENERGYLAKKVSSLEAEIASAPTKDMIDNMRHELRILKKLEYNAVDIDTEKEEPEMTSSPNDGSGDDLESVLIGKLRKIETDLVKERRESSAHYKECQNLKEKIVDLEKEKKDANTLIAQLEADLEKAIAVPASSSNTPSDIGLASLNTTSSTSTLQHILDPNAALPATSTAPNTQSNSAVEKMNDDHSVATIVMAQRDRLRARCEGLEAERDGFKRELQMQVATAESLKTDNTKLYEKVRYLQSYNNSSSARMHSRSNAISVDRDLDLEALEQRYEASVDPFKQFSRNERQRKLKEMSPMEKTVFIVARTVLGSKEMRTALFFYVSILHLLVFATTYHWSHGCHTVPHHSAIDSLHAGIPDVEGIQN